MRYLFVLVLALPMLSGCWFIFIPGSVTRAVADSFTGAEGSHCVASFVKVGDVIPLVGGGKGTVKSLSGPSTGCTAPTRPIRALVVAE